MADRRHAGILAVLLLLAGGLALATPVGPGSARLFGVSLLWWYCAAVAPLLSLLVAFVTLPTPPARLAASLSPVLVATLVARVFAGAPEAPLLILAAATAPLLGSLVGPLAGRRDGFAAVAGLASSGLLVWAGLSLAGDLALAFGRERWHGVGLAAAVALVGSLRCVGRLQAGLFAAGLVILAAPVLLLSARGVAPWHAWAAVASRPALLFGENAAAANEGVVLRVATAVDFDEAHRVTALSPAVYRVVERDGDLPAVREWRLKPGDALMLRPGDRLELAAGVRVRFEAGKRIPGAAVSGVAWADPIDRDHAVTFDVAAAALTLAAGTAALSAGRRAGRSMRGSGWARAAALALPVVSALMAACWGVYAAHAAPELGLGAPPVAALAGLPAGLPGALLPAVAVVAVLAALAALFAANVSALGGRMVYRARGRNRARLPLVWTAMILLAAGFALPAFDAWRALTWGWGLAAATLVTPALATERATVHRAAAIVGALVFASLAIGGGALAPWAPVVADYPALVALPAAWALAAALGRRLPARRVVRASR
jgi:hypothetical protein